MIWSYFFPPRLIRSATRFIPGQLALFVLHRPIKSYNFKSWRAPAARFFGSLRAPRPKNPQVHLRAGVSAIESSYLQSFHPLRISYFIRLCKSYLFQLRISQSPPGLQRSCCLSLQSRPRRLRRLYSSDCVEVRFVNNCIISHHASACCVCDEWSNKRRRAWSLRMKG